MKNFLSIIGALCLIVPIYLFWLWVHACNLAGDYPKNVALYNSYLPAILKGRYTTSLVGSGFSALAIILNGFGFTRKTKSFKLFSLIVIIIAAVLAFLNLWSMM
jgi:lysylphosphatidylglycerol synthetase-like protein (DUF2156 family)